MRYPTRRRRYRPRGERGLYHRRWEFGGTGASVMGAILFGLFAIPLLVLGVVLEHPGARWSLLATGLLFAGMTVLFVVFAVQFSRAGGDTVERAAVTRRIGLTFGFIGAGVAVGVLVALAVVGLTGGFD